MELLYALENIRCPLLDAVMAAVTELGGETVYMAVAIIAFWCVGKGLGYYNFEFNAAGIREGYVFTGGYEGAERRLVHFLPDWWEVMAPPIAALREAFHIVQAEWYLK